MKNKDNGRSMVEMLGVLAVIGVLSAGALKGYSNAMFKNKMNKTIDIYSQILQRVEELENKNIGEEISVENMVEYGLLEKCQEEDDDGSLRCRLPLGSIYVDLCDQGNYVTGELVVYFTSSKECVAFASAHWENATPIDWWSKADGNLTGGYIYIGDECIYDPYGVSGIIIKETTMDMIVKSCQICDVNKDSCRFYHTIRNEC